jgi:hypothetical protein
VDSEARGAEDLRDRGTAASVVVDVEHKHRRRVWGGTGEPGPPAIPGFGWGRFTPIMRVPQSPLNAAVTPQREAGRQVYDKGRDSPLST